MSDDVYVVTGVVNEDGWRVVTGVVKHRPDGVARLTSTGMWLRLIEAPVERSAFSQKIWDLMCHSVMDRDERETRESMYLDDVGQW